MRLNEILIEQQLDEKPMGFLSKLGNKAMATVGSKKAAGKLETGKEANWLKDQFMTFLGKIGKEAEPQTVIDFLKRNNYPTAGAERAMSQLTTGQKVGQAIGKGAAAAAKGVAAIGGAAIDGAKSVAGGVADIAKGAVAGAKAATAAPAAQASEKIPSQTDAAPAANKTISTTDNPNAPTFTGVPKKPAAVPAEPLKVSGVKKKKKIVAPAAIAASIDFSNTSSIMEALSSGQLDNVFLAAVQDAIARDEGGASVGGTGTAPTDVAQGGAKGFAQGLAKGARGPGADVPEEIKSQIEKLNPRQKKELGKLLA
jgi:hypothetical protein